MFDNFISLGFFCGVASSLSKYGFRNKSYPFDWNISNFKGVLHFIDTDFSEFLLKENLEVIQGEWPRIDDVKYDLEFRHDLKNEKNFELEYPEIYEKYARRIRRFRKDIQNPTCFLRAVGTEDELRYIIDNQRYIVRVIKHSNESNEIVFLIPPWLNMKGKLSLPYFILNIKEWGTETRADLESLFDNNDDLICYLQNNTTVAKVSTNLMWERNAERDKLRNEQLKIGVLRSRYNIAIELLNKELDIARIPSDIVIYGAGNIGKAFFNKCKMLCSVKYFIDENSQEKVYEGIPILSLEKVERGDLNIVCENYVITPTYDLDNIRKWFSERFPEAAILPVDTLFVEE